MKPKSLYPYIIGNHLEGCPGGGIATAFADYVTIDDNTVHDCSWYSIYGTSGISMLNDFDSNPTDISTPATYKDYVINNTVYNNFEFVKWKDAPNGPAITDGEGIIIDTNLNTDMPYITFGGTTPPNSGRYTGFTLVSNNVVYDNGSAGIQVFASQNVDVTYNTLFNNDLNYNIQTCPTPAGKCVPAEQNKGEIYLVDAINVNVGGNILYASIYDSPLKQIQEGYFVYAPYTAGYLSPQFYQNLEWSPWNSYQNVGDIWLYSPGNSQADVSRYQPAGDSNYGNSTAYPNFNNAWVVANGNYFEDQADGEVSPSLFPNQVDLTISHTTSADIQKGYNYLMLPQDRAGNDRVGTYGVFSIGAYNVPNY